MKINASAGPPKAQPDSSLKLSALVITAPPAESQHAFDRLIGTLQQRNNWNRQRATKELLRRLRNRSVSPEKPA